MINGIYWAGKTPDKLNEIKDEDFIDFFAYIYEYYWNKELIKKYGSIKKYLLIINERIPKLSLSNGQKWWAFVLFIQNDIAKDTNYQYLEKITEKLLNSIEHLSVIELEKYSNEINSLLITETIQTVIVRPFEMEELCGEEALNSNTLSDVLVLKDDMIKVLKRDIKEEYLSKEYRRRMFLYSETETLKFSDLITQYTEMFCSYLKNTYETINQDPRMKNNSSISKLKIIINTFFSISLNPGVLTEETKKDMLQILVKIFK